MGRSSLDLYSNDIGVPFPQITSFAAYVGGSPTNVCVGAQRLGLKTAMLTAVGEDPDRIVVDYIASMTDDYFVELYAHLFPDSGRKIEYIGYF